MVFMDTHTGLAMYSVHAGLTIVLVSWARGGQLGRRGKGYQVDQPFPYQCSCPRVRHGSLQEKNPQQPSIAAYSLARRRALPCSACLYRACGRNFKSVMASMQCVLEFPLACGIGAGTPVRIRGVPVGSVLTVNPSLEKVEVLIEVSHHPACITTVSIDSAS